MSRVTHMDLTLDIFIFIFKKFKKIINFKKIKKIKKNQKNHKLTRGTLTNDVNQLRLKGT